MCVYGGCMSVIKQLMEIVFPSFFLFFCVVTRIRQFVHKYSFQETKRTE